MNRTNWLDRVASDSPASHDAPGGSAFLRRALARLAAFVLLVVCCARPAWGQQQAAVSPDGVWTRLDAFPIAVHLASPWIRPDKFQPVRLDARTIGPVLAAAPLEDTPQAVNPIVIWLPRPDGTFERFTAVESPIMEPPLAAKFPLIKTYLGQGLDRPAATVRFDWMPAGFHAQVLDPEGSWCIDPYSFGDVTHYASYFRRDYGKRPDWVCETIEHEVDDGLVPAREPAPRGGLISRRHYRLACSATAEFTSIHSGVAINVPGIQERGLMGVVTGINRVTQIYENELSIRFILVAHNDRIIFTNRNTDPFTDGNVDLLRPQNQNLLDNGVPGIPAIGTANYDFGHVVGADGNGGVVTAGARVCGPNVKALATTTRTNPVGDPFWVDYTAHEMGHQFSAGHTWNGSGGGCSPGQWRPESAYEPGSGSTIMAYANLCGADNIQGFTDPYFHWRSRQQILAHSDGPGNCYTTQQSNNIAPTAMVPAATYVIPARTPFYLEGLANDPDSTDALTYCWEQSDLSPMRQPLATPDDATNPLFRSLTATGSSTRFFPRLEDVRANTNNPSLPGEQVPVMSRNPGLHFKLTVRDNRAGNGGAGTADVTVRVHDTGAPFQVTSPNGGEIWDVIPLPPRVVTWDPAGTAAAPIGAANVAIDLSLDDGLTWSPLLASTPNDGTENVPQLLTPAVASNFARIRVRAAGAGGIFYDMSDAPFQITGRINPTLNNLCADAFPIGNQVFAGAVIGNRDGPLVQCGVNTSADVWYSYTPRCDGLATFTMISGQQQNVGIYTGACAALVSVACARVASPQSFNFPVTANTRYLVRVALDNGHPLGYTFTARLSQTGAPANDGCGTPQVVGNGVTAFDSTCATTDVQNDLINMASDLWFQYTATSTGDTVFSTCGSAFDTEIAVYPIGVCTRPTLLAFDRDSCTPWGRVSLRTVVGTTYSIRVGGAMGATGMGSLTIAPNPVAPPTNDTCAGAIAIGPGSFLGSTRTATMEGLSGCDSFYGPDVYYRYQAADSCRVRVETCGGATNFDTVLSVHSRCPPNIASQIACSDDGCPVAQTRSTLEFNAVAGTPYYIRVSGYAGATGEFQLDVTQLPAANDACAAAIPIAPGWVIPGSTRCAAGQEGLSNCGNNNAPDVYYKFRSPVSCPVTLGPCIAADFAAMASVHTGCPTTAANEIACTNNCAPLVFNAVANVDYIVRVSGNPGTGNFVLGSTCPVGCPPPGPNFRWGLYRIVGISSGTSWSWHVAGAGFYRAGNTAFVPAGFGPDALATAWVASINADSCGQNRLAARLLPPPNNNFFVVQIAGNLPFTLCIGNPGGPALCCVPPSFFCAYNPDMFEEEISQEDCNANGESDSIDIMTGTSLDINADGVPDECTTCPCDWDHSGKVTSQDFFDFITGFFSDNADYNNDGETTSQDFFDFLACFFTGC